MRWTAGSTSSWPPPETSRSAGVPPGGPAPTNLPTGYVAFALPAK